MKVGKLLKERIEILDISIDALSKNTYIEIEVLKQLLEDKINFEQLDEYDSEILSNALYCTNNYFTNNLEYRKRDLIVSSKNRGAEDNKKAMETKCKIQHFIKDFLFISNIKNGDI